MKKLALVFILVSIVSTYGQNIQFVNAPNGLIIRKEPNKTSERIGKLQYGERVEIIKQTEFPLSIIDEGAGVNGFWTEIKETNYSPKGFVFNGFLSAKAINKGNETENFYLTKVPPLMIKNYWNYIMNSIEVKPAILYLRNKQDENLSEFSVSEFESFDNTSLYELGNKGLQNVKNIIVVKINYSSCCSNHYYTHLIQTNDDKILELPDFDYMHCDGPEPYKNYLFPNDTYGIKDKILFVNVQPATDSIPENIEVLKTFSFNGKSITEE